MIAYYTRFTVRRIMPGLLFAAGAFWALSTVLYGLSVLHDGPWRAVYGIWRPLYGTYHVHGMFFILFGMAILAATLLAAWIHNFGRLTARRRLLRRSMRRRKAAVRAWLRARFPASGNSPQRGGSATGQAPRAPAPTSRRHD